jgi:hypothetical protein
MRPVDKINNKQTLFLDQVENCWENSFLQA